MTISIWRYSHLALAVSSFVFIFLASITGIILAFEPISEQIKPYKVEGFNNIILSETLETLQKTYPEVISIEVDDNDFVIASVITNDGDALNGYINPKTGEFLGTKIEKSSFFQWTTNLHRSLFLKGIGRFFVGLCSFLLFLIAVSGTVLIIKRQRSFKRFFSKIINENFNQYWHVVLGRLSLIPIIIITITGVYLSLLRFDLLPKDTISHQIDDDTFVEIPKQNLNTFSVFKNTQLSDVKAIEFPFSDDVEDYFILKLKDKELLINQFDGSIISEKTYPLVSLFSNWSITLHTGQGTIIWSIILAIACVNILFFIYSGFAMTLKRQKSKLKNRYKKQQSQYIILVGSENGSTITFANKLYEHLITYGKKAYITELNNYKVFKKAEHIIVVTATYGQGDAPTNADKFLKLLDKTEQKQNFKFSVVGFGSLAYPDYCKFAFDVNVAFLKKANAMQALQPYTINDKSVDAFQQWLHLWNASEGIENTTIDLNLPKPKTNTFEVVHKTDISQQVDNTFIITLKSKQKKAFQSGDLLAIYPKNDILERMYSIGKLNGNIQLSVKLHPNGVGSNFLTNLQVGETLQARLISNASFHFPKKAKRVILIANGTGIAPFLGMLNENSSAIETHLYYGLRHERSLDIYKSSIENALETNKLSKNHLAFSQCFNHLYVQNLIERDAKFISESLKNDAIIMICGSLAMQNAVVNVLEAICVNELNSSFNQYKKQVLMDCY
uniref:PepSY domain-containing protein n=2 Tax=Gelidibacter sp. TaxID=2018083 RepID=UPI004049AD1E